MRYDEVLKNGLPDWRQAVYYYRRVRKMGLAEMSVILFVLVTVGQYIVSWAAYLEKKYTAVSVMKSFFSFSSSSIVSILYRLMEERSTISSFPFQFFALALLA
jgi:hypothetical protein